MKKAKIKSILNKDIKNKGNIVTDIKKLDSSSGNICKKLENIYKNDKANIEEKKSIAFRKLGIELWGLYQANVLENVFKQETVRKIIEEIEGYDYEKIKYKNKKIVRKKEEEHRIMLKNAIANFKSKDVRIRKASIRIIDKLEDSEAIPHLAGLLDDPEEAIRDQAASLMHKLLNGMESKIKNNSEQNIGEENE